MTIRMTYDDYDAMLEKVNSIGFRASDFGSFWPSPEVMSEKFKVRGRTDIEFVQWLLETNDPPYDEEERKSKKYLLRTIYDSLVLVDPEETAEG